MVKTGEYETDVKSMEPATRTDAYSPERTNTAVENPPRFLIRQPRFLRGLLRQTPKVHLTFRVRFTIALFFLSEKQPLSGFILSALPLSIQYIPFRLSARVESGDFRHPIRNR